MGKESGGLFDFKIALKEAPRSCAKSSNLVKVRRKAIPEEM